MMRFPWLDYDVIALVVLQRVPIIVVRTPNV
jgi:hypothetical protein